MSNSQPTLTIVGCGDLGRRLAARVSPQGYLVKGIRRRAMAAASSISYRSADVLNRASLAAALRQPGDVLVVTLTPSDYSAAGYQQTYVQGSANLLATLAAGESLPGLLLFVSSTSVYGQQQGEWVDEESVTEPAGYSGQYLLEAERLLAGCPCPAVSVRFSGIYGPGRTRLLQRTFQEHKAQELRAQQQKANDQIANNHKTNEQTLREHTPKHESTKQQLPGARNTAARGTGSETDSFSNRIHAEDCAAVLAHLIALHDRGTRLSPCYLASDCLPVRSSEVRQWLAAQMGLQSTARTTPAAAPDAAIGGKRCRNQRLLDSGFQFQYPDFKAGYRELVGDFLRQHHTSSE